MIKNPLYAIKDGIGMVQQHFMLLPSLSVAENLVLGSEPKKKKFFMDYDKAVEITNDLAKKYGFKVDPYEKIENLSVGVLGSFFFSGYSTTTSFEFLFSRKCKFFR